MQVDKTSCPHLGHFAFIAGWWTLLIVFASAGSGNLGILWILISVFYFIFHPDYMAQKGTTLEMGPHTALILLELLSSSILLSYIFTCIAWTIGIKDGLFDHPTPMFFFVGFAFLMMGSISLIGVIANLLLASKSHSSTGTHAYLASVVVGYALIIYFFPNWLFSSALDKVGHKAHVIGAGAALAALLAYYIIRKYQNFAAQRTESIDRRVRYAVGIGAATVLGLVIYWKYWIHS